MNYSRLPNPPTKPYSTLRLFLLFPYQRSTMPPSPKTILASASPRRRQLLAPAGIPFDRLERRIAAGHPNRDPPSDNALRMPQQKPPAASARPAGPIFAGAAPIL